MEPRWKISLAATGCGLCCLLGQTLPALVLLAVLTALGLQAARRSERDALTGLGNRHRLARRKRAYRHKARLALVYVDLDHLKTVNDTQGHSRGDALLTALARALERTSAGQAELYRLGGDEFLAVLPETALEGFLIRWDGEPRDFSASLGWAAGPGAAFDSLLSQAEAAMYRSR